MKLIRNNQGFTCEHCMYTTGAAKGPSRNHCPKCLYSKHVDNVPGDRANLCHGLMKPISAQLLKGGRLSITFQCGLCSNTGNNISAQDDTMELMGELLAEHNKGLHRFS